MRKTLILRGIRMVRRKQKKEVRSVIRKFLGIKIYAKKVREIEGGLLVEFQSFSNKIGIIKRKGILRG